MSKVDYQNEALPVKKVNKYDITQHIHINPLDITSQKHLLNLSNNIFHDFLYFLLLCIEDMVCHLNVFLMYFQALLVISLTFVKDPTHFRLTLGTVKCIFVFHCIAPPHRDVNKSTKMFLLMVNFSVLYVCWQCPRRRK